MIEEEATLRVGDVRIDALYDMPFDIDRERIFPSVSDEDWAGLEDHLTAEGKVRLEIVCYLIRSQGNTILCDTGLGKFPGTEDPGHLLEALAATGVRPEEIDSVVFTHLHGDHVGWNVDWSSGEPKAVFPNAKYVIQKTEWEHFASPERKDSPSSQRQLLPIEALGSLQLLSGDHSFTDEVKAIVTSGHTPGHMSLEIASQGERALVQGDVVVHHVLLPRPLWEPRFDFEPEGARKLRGRMLPQWAEERLLIIANHFPAPGYGYVEKDGDAWRWVPMS